MTVESNRQSEAVHTEIETQPSLVEILVHRYQDAAANQAGHPIMDDLAAFEKWLDHAYQYFREATQQELALTYVSEWILDNYYIVQQAIDQIDEDLPAGYYRQLPKLTSGPLQGFPRIYGILRHFLSSQHLLIRFTDLQSLLINLQDHIPLTMGELWAVPIFLRYGAVEALAHALDDVIRPSDEPPLPRARIVISEDGREPSDPSALVANAILSLRAITDYDWQDFFESISQVERILRDDPAGVYPKMDFKTRDHYRKQLEQMALSSGWDETALAKLVVETAHEASGANGRLNPAEDRKAHVGYYLTAAGRREIEKRLTIQQRKSEAARRWVLAHPTEIYLGSIAVLTILQLLFLTIVLVPRLSGASFWILFTIFFFLSINPALTAATHIVNWLITLVFPPHVLPKLLFEEGVPEDYHTLVVIPALINSKEEVDELAQQLRQHYLRNPQPGLSFALLLDFIDADSEMLPDDEILVDHSRAAIDQLNQDHPAIDGGRRFFLFQRRRVYNPSEGKWMGWERKRGKLHELNLLLLRKEALDQPLSFFQLGDSLDELPPVRFIITLDADTILPIGAAQRLAGTLAHPLNRAVFDPKSGKVTEGYTLLQPRVEISPTSANRSWFTRIFAGDAGLDLYSRAISDVYQDLFYEGIYVGKGIYDLSAFEQSVAGHIPENRLLSHDLLEGMLGRAGLVSDITLIEDYPPNYIVQIKRQQRWIRGDWQLLPWLLRPRQFGVRFSTIDVWKILDNLRRSLLPISVFLLFLIGLLLMPGLAWIWTTIVLLAFNIPTLTGFAMSLRQVATGEPPAGILYPILWSLLRGLLAVAYVPFEAFYGLKTITKTLYRLLFTKKNLLQWTTAAKVAQSFGENQDEATGWRQLIPVTALSLGLVIWLTSVSPASLPGAAPVLLLWLVSPAIAYGIRQPVHRTDPRETNLNETELALLRQVARLTWSFFEHFVGPEDHWLPPDNYQEAPVGVVAHRTSPTNIGLLLNSTLAAYDLGYIEPIGLVTRLTATFDTLERLERFRGHFINWYDTVSLQPLQPRYVSTVDSGNLAASLIVTAQACQSLPLMPIFRWQLWQGYLDTLAILQEVFTRVNQSSNTRPVGSVQVQEEILAKMRAMSARIRAVENEPRQWYALFREVSGPFWQDLSTQLGKLVSAKPAIFTLEDLQMLTQVSAQLERQHLSVQRTLNELAPWVPLMASLPPILREPEFSECLRELRTVLPNNPSISEIRDIAFRTQGSLSWLRQQLQERSSGSQAGGAAALQEALNWLDALEQAAINGQGTAGVLINGFNNLSSQAERYVREMDFSFLYHPQRRIFHIGYNLDSGQLDNNYYDLLASEARIASLIAIAKGEAPTEHWLQIGRPITQVQGMRVLLSWSATMFEYLMPPLFVRSYPGTLLTESAQGAVAHQIDYGKSKGVPWGISESGFYRFDASQSYQYRAFGVPGLGFKRGLGDDLVIAPYASLMAVGLTPRKVVQNLRHLMDLNMLGRYGLYESVDFTGERLLVGEDYALVREYMSHHQGMILLALDNFFNQDIMVQRMHGDPRIQSIDLLLQEQVPLTAPLRNPHTQNVKGVQRIAQDPVDITPWAVPVQTPIPQMHLLSNGSYNVVITNSGSGYSSWNGIDLTRWQPDGVLDNRGVWLYIQDLPAEPVNGGSGNELWSAGYQPIPGSPTNVQATFFAHMVVLRRSERGINSTVEVTVPPDDAVEIRRVHLHNESDRKRSVRLTSYGEVILTQQAGDARHPAFNKLFIDSEYVPELNLQIFKRRPRSENEAPVFLGHMLVLATNQEPDSAHEADRYRFIGRYGSIHKPQALSGDQYLSGASGATLDPIFSLGQTVKLAGHQSIQMAFLTIAADSRDQLTELATRYRSWVSIERAFQQADIAAQSWLGQQNYNSQALQNTLQALSSLFYANKFARASADILAKNRLGQPGLWRFGVSGDYPILVVEVGNPDQVGIVHEALKIHYFLRTRRILADVVIINCQQTNYGAELNGTLFRLVSRNNSEQWLNQRGGIFILYRDQMQDEEYTLLQTAARLVLSGERGSLQEQLPGYSIPVPHLPEFQSTRPEQAEAVPGDSQAGTEPRLFFNGHGGFSPDGREYMIDIAPGQPVPAPWSNVIGYAQFGFLVTEAGSQCTWAVNSGENRLTPWSNDPVADPTGEALYLRDEETGAVWTPTPLPAGKDAHFKVRHGAGYTIFEHSAHGLGHRLSVFASPDEPIKIVQLQLQNLQDQVRRITVTEYVEWVLGTIQATTKPFIIPEYDADNACLLATNPYNTEFQGRVAFLAANKPVRGVTADRAEFLGRSGTYQFPAALSRLGLETRISPGEDPCGALQVQVELQPYESEEVIFLIGQGENRAESMALVEKYRQPDAVTAAWTNTQSFWDRLLDTIQVDTPNAAMNLILNRWLLYQSLSCRLWGRSAFYQSSGAYGFRDQLQDVLALCAIDPGLTREQILNAARHQFEEGDVLHWWHPPSGRGVRTRFSDDLLWLPYVTAIYIETTGDLSILEENQPFRTGPQLKPGEEERYGEYPLTEQAFSILDHCLRAIARGSTSGPHGLPLMGTGDWNDGMNKVGEEGRGESVWLAWFLIDILNRFAGILELYQPDTAGELCELARKYRARAQEYAQHVEEAAWDGAWYRRAYYDDGSTLGSAEDMECQIDAIAQSWSILSKAGNPQRSRQAMQSVRSRLVRPEDRLILLFTPPFDQTPHNPGYIKGYLPGIRENGGQYTHAAIWTVWAYAALGHGEAAGQLFDLLNPIYQADEAAKAAVYRVEPYVICADVYSVEPYVRRGGWTWYTGSAAWMYRLGIEGLLGIRRAGQKLLVDPTIPSSWDGFTVTYRLGETVYRVEVRNPQHVGHGVQGLTVDGESQTDQLTIELIEDGQEHQVIVLMG